MLTIEHMAMFVVKSIHIQIYGQVMDLSVACFQRELMSEGYVNQQMDLFSPQDLLSVARQVARGMVGTSFL